MPLALALVFHFNQHLSEHARPASRACYRGLLGVLRRHPSLKFNLHLSGTLTHALAWLDPEPLESIRAGLADGQFELLGSTYAQNVAYATDDWDNARQIELHRQTMRQIFGVEPTSFWNPERCWRQSLAPLIADAGYRTALVEDHILRRSGAAQPQVFRTRAEERELAVVYDDETFKHKFNFAAWFGQPRQAVEHLQQLADHPGSDAYCIAYAEDAEAMGLWGYMLGVIPHQTWANLDALLTHFETLPWLRLTLLSDAPPPAAELTPIADGSATWMDNSLRISGAPYHEGGYANWFDFVARSPKLALFGALYAEVRGQLQPLQGGNSLASIERLYRLAVHTLCGNQYEFACIGIGGEGYAGWEGARAAFAIARAAALAQHPRTGAWREDVDCDGREEILLCDGKQFAVVAGDDARLLYAFDLSDGSQWIGNQLAVPVYPDDKPLPARWLPDAFESDVSHFATYRADEAAPTRLARFLPDWVWRDEPAALPLYTRDMRVDGTHTPVPILRCALREAVDIEGQPAQLSAGANDVRVEAGAVASARRLDSGIVFATRVSLEGGNVRAEYTLRNDGSEPRAVRVSVTNELCPDYAEVLSGGRASLAFVEDDERPGVRNTRTGRAIRVDASPRPSSVERAEGLFALVVTHVFEFELPPQSERRFSVKLNPQPRSDG